MRATWMLKTFSRTISNPDKFSYKSLSFSQKPSCWSSSMSKSDTALDKFTRNSPHSPESPPPPPPHLIIMYSFMCHFSKLEHIAKNQDTKQRTKTQSKQTHAHAHKYTVRLVAEQTGNAPCHEILWISIQCANKARLNKGTNQQK